MTKEKECIICGERLIGFCGLSITLIDGDKPLQAHYECWNSKLPKLPEIFIGDKEREKKEKLKNKLIEETAEKVIKEYRARKEKESV